MHFNVNLIISEPGQATVHNYIKLTAMQRSIGNRIAV